MTTANEIQHGGDHYKGAAIQHWDFITDHKIGYLEGCATKYISRHLKKNGLEDLNKAEHYVQKILEKYLDDNYRNFGNATWDDCRQFCNGAELGIDDSRIFCNIVMWRNHVDLEKIIPDIRVAKWRYGK